MDVNANINQAECMVTKTHLGYDTFVNVCTGVTRNVDWTAFDWGALTFLLALALLALAMLVGLIIMVVAAVRS